MSRITSNEVQGLMEAYNAVYAPQELTEEQIWEEVENWVNSLLEEGHDLSEYTWEEMYEAYIDEARRGAAPFTPSASPSKPLSLVTPGGGGSGARRGAAPSRVARPQIGSLPPSARQVTQYPQGVSTGVGGGNASASRPATPSAPKPAPTRPATPSAPKPAPSAPKPQSQKGPTGMPLVGGIERRIPTSAELKASQEKRAAQKSVASSFTSPAISRVPKYAPPAFNLKQSYDLYDVIKGHLLDEGYADTEEAAEAIMVSMSEDWKQSIVEQVTGPGLDRPMEGPTPGHLGPTSPPPVPEEKNKRSPKPKLTPPPPVK